MSRLEVVIFDWAGTIVDHGSLAPVRAICELFARHHVVVDDDAARRDMGLLSAITSGGFSKTAGSGGSGAKSTGAPGAKPISTACSASFSHSRWRFWRRIPSSSST